MGLQAGDKILEIDGESTMGITINGAVDKLRGKPGTPVTIKVGREGAVEPIDYTVIRDIIRIESVPFASMLNDTVGYVKITQFSKRTDEDLKKKVLQLKKDGASALILDLRNNPGGLLNQAISVSDLFLPKSKLVVFTKGRVRSQNKEYFSESGPVWGGQQKLIILVNEGSASASEIVAGAIQDHDRGLIMGKTSFGKGSVQTILPLDQDNNALKLTTAYYYTPSGRCINKIENAMQKIRDKAKAEEDSAASKDSAEVFTTDSGRKVHARGGITPDIEVEGNLYDRYLREMERRTMFFKFIVKVRPRLEKAGKVTLNTQISSKITDEYKDFIMNDSAFTQFKSASHIMLEEFAKTMEKERKSVGDTLKSKINNEIDMLKTSLAELLVQKTKMEFDKNLDYIKYALKRELLQASLGDSARNVHEISIDKQVKKAMEYLSDTKLYKSALVAQKD
jgi:carboxyl-terminal processing protease